MPNYEFRCRDCGQKFTRQLAISERKNTDCPQCGSRSVEQIFTCCNVMGGKGSGSAAEGGASACSRTGGCAGCSGC